MIRRYLISTAVLVLAACADAPTAVQDRAAPEGGSLLSTSTITSTIWNIFTTQTPASTLDASPGWEVATRFYVTEPGCVTGLRFWRAAGETGTNTIRLWDNSGLQRASRTVSSGSGWQGVSFTGFICLGAEDTYKYWRVSVNTNTKQVKTFGAFGSGVIANGPLVADAGYYGQPMGSRPTNISSSNFFVDVEFSTGFGF